MDADGAMAELDAVIGGESPGGTTTHLQRWSGWRCLVAVSQPAVTQPVQSTAPLLPEGWSMRFHTVPRSVDSTAPCEPTLLANRCALRPGSTDVVVVRCCLAQVATSTYTRLHRRPSGSGQPGHSLRRSPHQRRACTSYRQAGVSCSNAG